MPSLPIEPHAERYPDHETDDRADHEPDQATYVRQILNAVLPQLRENIFRDLSTQFRVSLDQPRQVGKVL